MFIEPVIGEDFFGREEIIGTLRKRVTDLKGGYRQNIALAGPMLTGKSSILRHFLGSMPEEGVIPVYIDLDGADFSVFVKRYIATLLFGYLLSEGLSADNDLEKLINGCEPLIPSTIMHITEVRELLEKRRKNLAYSKLLDLTSVFKKETGKSCLVVLDEFHNLAHYQLRTPFKIFGKYIMVQKDTMYIVSSSQKNLLKEILSRKLSLLFGNFELLEVKGFDNSTARSFVTALSCSTPVPEDVMGYFLEISQGNPFYLRALVNAYSQIAVSCSSLGAVENLLDTLAELLYKAEGVLNQYFTNNVNFFLEKRSRRKFIPILVSLARGNSTMRQVRKDLGSGDKDLRVKLRQLESMDLVYSNGNFYKITDKLFEYWLRNVYDLKKTSLVDDVDIKYLEFKDKFARDFREYSVFREQEASFVVEQLFRRFANQKIRVGLSCRKMPRFRDVTRRKLSDNVAEVVGVQEDPTKKWVCHVKTDDIAVEEDINRLKAVRSGKKGCGIARRIFVPLKGVDQNALLLAKDKNIWVWDIDKFNEKLHLFGSYGLVI